MNKEIADKWVAALRSGNYKQTASKLKNHAGGFCCLGVLCDISNLGSWDKNNNEACEVYVPHEAKADQGFSTLPMTVMRWAEMDDNCGSFRESYRIRTSLVGLNDSGKSFEEIADIIEASWERL